MDADKKTNIDNIWKNTDVGQWIFARATGDVEHANKIIKKNASEPPFSFEQCVNAVCLTMSKEFEDIDEFEDYLKALDKEQPDVVEFIISDDTFGKIYDYLKQ